MANCGLRNELEKRSIWSAAPEKLVELETKHTVSEAFSKLLRGQVLSAPLRDSVTGEYRGVIDLLDVMTVVVEMFPEDIAKRCSGQSIFEAIKQFAENTQATALIDLAKEHPLLIVNADTSLLDTLVKMTENNARRVAIRGDQNNELRSYISQAGILRYIWKEVIPTVDPNFCVVNDCNIPCLNRTVEQLGLDKTADIITMKDSMSAYEGFKMMASKKLSALPILDSENKVIGCLSSSDIRPVAVQGTNFHSLFLPVLDYLAPIRAQNLKDRVPIITIQAKDRLAHVAGRLAVAGVHRLYVVDELSDLCAVISISDLLQCFTRVLEN